MTATKQRGGRRAGAGRVAGVPSKVVRLPATLADLAHELATAKRYGDVASFIDVEGRSALRVPMMAWSAAAGFPSRSHKSAEGAQRRNGGCTQHGYARRSAIYALTRVTRISYRKCTI